MQINISRVRGSNAMTYGDFDFTVDQFTVYQLIGKNGSGKSSLPVILEEILFNSNSRGVAKADIPHMFSGIKGWWGEVHFSIEEDLYIVRKDVKASAKVKLTKNGENISGHTATQTYSLIKSILGDLDFKTFSKLVYQSMDSSLDFLTATDANRKKFLVSLLGLEKYGEIEEQLKSELKEAKSSQVAIKKEHDNIESWIENAKNLPDVLEVVEVPEEDLTLQVTLEDAVGRLASVEVTNREVDSHNKEILRLQGLLKKQNFLREQVQTTLSAKPIDVSFDQSKLAKARTDLTKLNADMVRFKDSYTKFKREAGNTKCHTCGTHLDVTAQTEARDIAHDDFYRIKPLRDEAQAVVDSLLQDEKAYIRYTKWQNDLEKSQRELDTFEESFSLEGQEIPEPKCKTYSKDIEDEITQIRRSITSGKRDVKQALQHNEKALISNAKREEQLSTLEKYQEQVQNLREKLKVADKVVAQLEILCKAFGPKGLVSYKIESSVKVFEELINQYLSKFLDGDFALTFELDGAKLKVVMYSSGVKMGMKSLSSGEKNAVTISTLLAIRTLMSSISKTNLNLLFLDEVISVLDNERRDTLIEILLQEHHLNTFLVSHGYNHPLTKDIHIEKVNKISKVVNG